MNSILFFREGIKNLKTAGTIARSSRFLCQAMIKPIDFENAKVIVELGAGDGVITEYILQNMKPDAKLLAFELNDTLCDHIREIIHDERFVLIQDSAEHIEKYLDKYNFTHIDYVVSGLPFIVLPKALANNIIEQCKKLLRNKGKFIQFHYSFHPKKIYKNYFGNVKVDFVPLNIPPAFVMVCEKE